MLTISTLVLALGAAPTVLGLTLNDGKLRVVEFTGGAAAAPKERLVADQPCPVTTAQWSAAHDRVLVTSACQLSLLTLSTKKAQVLPASPAENAIVQWATDGAVLAIARVMGDPAEAFELKGGKWVSIEKSADANLKSDRRLLKRQPEGARKPSADEAKALPPGFEWQVRGDGAYAAALQGTDACFLTPPIALRSGKEWKVLIEQADCAATQRAGGWLMVDAEDGRVWLAAIDSGVAEQFPAGLRFPRLVAKGVRFAP